MANMFRLLRANEIDARVGTVKPNGISLLLYKDARCDQNILDETVGAYNWQRSHSRDNANCVVSLWDSEKKQWISKEDTGTESKTEAEKGLASDSFKRACVNWGIGRELYSAPFIWISGKGEDLKYEKFTVTEIGYDQNREINKLQIINKNGIVVYKYGDASKVYNVPKEPEPEGKMDLTESIPVTWQVGKALTHWAVAHGITAQQFNEYRLALVAGGVIKDIPSKSMTPIDFDNICKAIEANYGDQLKHEG